MKKLLFIVALLTCLFSACSPSAQPAATQTPTLPPNTKLYTNAEGGFTISIPSSWSVAGPILAGHNLYRFGLNPTSSNGPDSGQVIIADAASLSIEMFAQQMCGNCIIKPIEAATLGGLPAKRALIGGMIIPQSEWYFVTRAGKLIGFSFPPVGDAPQDWILGTLHFGPSPVVDSPGWTSYWDAYYGYGIAIPCWWKVNPTGEHGGAMTLRSYDDAFFEAHSTKGQWTDMVAPLGAVKMDVMVFEGVDPSTSTEDAIRQINSPEVEIVSMQPVDLNAHAALLVKFKHPTTDLVTYARAFYLRLTPDKLMVLSTYPDEMLGFRDVQSIIHSLAFSKNEGIAIPIPPPSTPLIEVPTSCM